uniref:Uncharacterized protein n=1 Tax=Amphimedon queenslandica TaxID=400682 RepID=A0A1X7SJ23_AMPQE
MLVLDCRSGDTTVISVQCGPQLKETLCEVLVSSEDGPPGSIQASCILILVLA